MKKLLALSLVLAACTGTWTHNDTMELRYTGVVAATGGALLVVDPLLNGDRLGASTTAIGAVLVAIGVGAIVGSLVLAPATPDSACGP